MFLGLRLLVLDADRNGARCPLIHPWAGALCVRVELELVLLFGFGWCVCVAIFVIVICVCAFCLVSISLEGLVLCHLCSIPSLRASLYRPLRSKRMLHCVLPLFSLLTAEIRYILLTVFVRYCLCKRLVTS